MAIAGVIGRSAPELYCLCPRLAPPVGDRVRSPPQSLSMPDPGSFMSQLFIAAPVRTPIGKFGGSFATLTAAELGGASARETLRRAGVAAGEVGYTVFSNARQARGRPKPVRHAGRRAGLLDEALAHTL